MNFLHHSPLPSLPHSWNSFHRSHFSIYAHVYTVFAPYSLSYTLSLHLPPSHWYQTPVLLFSDFVKKKKIKKKTFLFAFNSFSIRQFTKRLICHQCLNFNFLINDFDF
jgi:hypothetical protein